MFWRAFSEWINLIKGVKNGCSLGSLNGSRFDVDYRTGECCDNTRNGCKVCNIRRRNALLVTVLSQCEGPIKVSANRHATMLWPFPTIGKPDDLFWWTCVTTTERNQWRLRVVSEVDSWTSCLCDLQGLPGVSLLRTLDHVSSRFEMLSLYLSWCTLSSVPYTHSRCSSDGENQRRIRRLNTPFSD